MPIVKEASNEVSDDSVLWTWLIIFLDHHFTDACGNGTLAETFRAIIPSSKAPDRVSSIFFPSFTLGFHCKRLSSGNRSRGEFAIDMVLEYTTQVHSDESSARSRHEILEREGADISLLVIQVPLSSSYSYHWPGRSCEKTISRCCYHAVCISNIERNIYVCASRDHCR